MAVRGKKAVTDATGADLFGPQEFQDDCVLHNRGAEMAFMTANGDTAVDDIGYTIAAGESVNTNAMPAKFKLGEWKAVCAAGETAIIYWAFE